MSEFFAIVGDNPLRHSEAPSHVTMRLWFAAADEYSISALRPLCEHLATSLREYDRGESFKPVISASIDFLAILHMYDNRQPENTDGPFYVRYEYLRELSQGHVCWHEVQNAVTRLADAWRKIGL